jgi:hypothetical protein
MTTSSAVANGATAVAHKGNAVLVRTFVVSASARVVIAQSSFQCHRVVQWFHLRPQLRRLLPHLASAGSAPTDRAVVQTSTSVRDHHLAIAVVPVVSAVLLQVTAPPAAR